MVFLYFCIYVVSVIIYFKVIWVRYIYIIGGWVFSYFWADDIL